MTEPQLTFPDRVGVVNVGLSLFADAIREQGAPVISVDWRVPAGGQPDAVAALGRLYGIHAERIEAANAEVLRRLDAGTPLLTGVTTVARAMPALVEGSDRTLLHCGPAVGYADAPDPLRRSMRAAAVAEGWADSLEQADARLARGEIGLAPANEHRVVVPMATALGASAPLYVVENQAGGTTAYAPVSQGPGEVAWFGVASEASVARLAFLRDVAGPVIGRILERSDPLDVLSLAAQAVAMGDDVHVRTQAATILLIRTWLPQLTELGGQDGVAFARFLSGNHLFFLTLAMAAARSLTEWAAQVADASIVTTMARNGTTFGIRLPGSDRWFTAGAPEVGHALYYPGQGPQTSARDIGDSAVLELAGLGAAAAAGSPAVAQLLGGDLREAAGLTSRLAAVCAGRSSRFKIPVLDNAGTPLGVDVRKVVELGLTPAVTTGILHLSAGTGQVGAGVAEAPLPCFTAALTDLDRRLTSPATPDHPTATSSEGSFRLSWRIRVIRRIRYPREYQILHGGQILHANSRDRAMPCCVFPTQVAARTRTRTSVTLTSHLPECATWSRHRVSKHPRRVFRHPIKGVSTPDKQSCDGSDAWCMEPSREAARLSRHASVQHPRHQPSA